MIEILHDFILYIPKQPKQNKTVGINVVQYILGHAGLISSTASAESLHPSTYAVLTRGQCGMPKNEKNE